MMHAHDSAAERSSKELDIMSDFLQLIYNQMDSPHLFIAATPSAAFEFEGFDLNSDVSAPSA